MITGNCGLQGPCLLILIHLVLIAPVLNPAFLGHWNHGRRPLREGWTQWLLLLMPSKACREPVIYANNNCSPVPSLGTDGLCKLEVNYMKTFNSQLMAPDFSGCSCRASPVQKLWLVVEILCRVEAGVF